MKFHLVILLSILNKTLDTICLFIIQLTLMYKFIGRFFNCIAKFYLSSVFEQLKDLLFLFTEFIAALTADGLEHCRNQSYSGVIHT